MDNQEASIHDSAGHNRTPRVRPEMTGPRDITDILSRLKTKPAANQSTDTSKPALALTKQLGVANLHANLPNPRNAHIPKKALTSLCRKLSQKHTLHYRT